MNGRAAKRLRRASVGLAGPMPTASIVEWAKTLWTWERARHQQARYPRGSRRWWYKRLKKAWDGRL